MPQTDQTTSLTVLKNYWMTNDIRKEQMSSQDVLQQKIDTILKSGRTLTEQQIQNLRMMMDKDGEPKSKQTELDSTLERMEFHVKSYREKFFGARESLDLDDSKNLFRLIESLYPKEQADDINWRVMESSMSAGKFDNEVNVRMILYLRHEIARSRGFKNVAEYRFAVQPTIMKTPDNARKVIEHTIQESYKDLKKEISILKNEYPDFDKVSIPNLNRYYSRYSQNHKGDNIKITYAKTRDIIFEFLKEMFNITFVSVEDKELGPEYEMWDFNVNDKKGRLFLDMFQREGKPLENAKCSYKTIEGLEVGMIVCHFNQQSREKMDWNDIRVFLHELGHFVFYAYNETDRIKLPLEFNEIPSMFMEKFLAYPLLLHQISSQPNITPQNFGSCFGQLVESMKNLLDLDVHSVKDAHRLMNVKTLENETFSHIYKNLICDEIFPEFLDIHILTLTNLYKSFGLFHDATAYRYLVADMGAQILYDGLINNKYTIQDIIELWRRPKPGNSLYDLLTYEQTYLNLLNA